MLVVFFELLLFFLLLLLLPAFIFGHVYWLLLIWTYLLAVFILNKCTGSFCCWKCRMCLPVVPILQHMC
jgi:hypothetical protein